MMSSVMSVPLPITGPVRLKELIACLVAAQLWLGTKGQLLVSPSNGQRVLLAGAMTLKR